MSTIAKALLKAGLITKEQEEAIEAEERRKEEIYSRTKKKPEPLPRPNTPAAKGTN